MARAKHTDRADARRRYRQALAAEGVATEGMTDEELDAGAAARAEARQPRSGASRRAASPAPTERPGITSAFRTAYHPARVREDIAVLPMLVRERAFLIPVALVLAGLASVAIAANSPIASLAFQALVVPPAMAPVFIAGFFAKRASYIIGFLVALIDVAAYGIFLYAIAPSLSSTADALSAAKQQEFLLSALSVGPLSGIFFAAAAAWYRRFLSLSNRGAAQRRQARAQASRSRASKPARG